MVQAACRLRAQTEKDVRRTLRAALWARLGARRRAARVRRFPLEGARANAAAETGFFEKILKNHGQVCDTQKTRHLLARPEEAPRNTVFDGEKLISGNQVTGPAIVETADTTVVVHP